MKTHHTLVAGHRNVKLELTFSWLAFTQPEGTTLTAGGKDISGLTQCETACYSAGLLGKMYPWKTLA